MEIHDVVYGTINCPADITAIIRTPQFQRLKAIKQVGLIFLVHPPAIQTRYEHCIGTYWQARRMLDSLVKNTLRLAGKDIPLVYRKAVEIAALLHDVGHGPFSHAWEHIGIDFYHEENALPCVDAIFASLDANMMCELRANHNYGIELIKALILGDPTHLPQPLPTEYGFLFEIVNNKTCKIDVDKWDYLKRDMCYLREFCEPNIDFDDVFLEARISDTGSHIEYRYEDYEKIYRIFVARWTLHLHCYRLPRNIVGDHIIKRIIKRCEERICGKSLPEITAHDMEAFLQLTDDLVLALASKDPEYKYLHHVYAIKQIEQPAAQNGQFSETMLTVRELVCGPGQEMPSDENFHFYGCESNKQRIERNSKSTNALGYFLLN